MSGCSFCGNGPRLERVLSSDFKTSNNSFVANIPLHGQVFGLPPPSKYPPFFRKKLNDKELREGIDKHELWMYVPPWQVPRVNTKHHRTAQPPMKKILCMAKRNETSDGYIGELRFVFPRFGKNRQKQISEKIGKKIVRHN